MIMVEAGKIRLSQLITTFGPGSLLNLKNDTVMILGLEFWPENNEEKKYLRDVSHPYLSQQLQKSFFQVLASDDISKIPCISFPKWKLCQRCHRLQIPKANPSSKGFACENCDSKLSLLHSYFVQMCDNGHIWEFPWEEWAHLPEKLNERKTQCTKKYGEEAKLEFITAGTNMNWYNYKVKCLHCKSEKTMKGATSKKIFKRFNFTCQGKQPWLNKDDPKCDEDAYGIQVNSTATYYPFSATALLIPKWFNPFDELLDKNDGTLRKRIRDDYANNIPTDAIINFYKSNSFKEILKSYSATKVKEMLESRFTNLDNNSSVEDRALEQEFDDFIVISENKQLGPKHDRKIDIEPLDISHSILQNYHITHLMKFHRLIAINVLRGFTRGIPPDPFATENQLSKGTIYRQISSNRSYGNRSITNIDWLPAIETKGEGIFFSFDDDALSEWESRPNVQERYEAILNSYAESIDKRKFSEKEIIKKTFNSPRYILLHTFAHLLIREIVDYAGYHEASLRERIYSTNNGKKRNGILIYTSSFSSGGSLGGLVRLGDIEKFEGIIKNTIKRSNTCSGDPLCRERNPVELKELALDMTYSGSACYACTIISETSCQNFNNLLDRWMIRDPNDGFFRDKIKNL